ncbi:histidine kinase [Solimonas aquatica]|uniref:histidine kinase n=1 Tax=Solimonas aquatica TaxID=489703 RepID=A0A1H9LJK5_9GAMM|nr:hybrid sensor histidine kinase/response regulator [Solimonas aquatica]SER11584.1 histidine kinase [Solimonas aquatica]
MAEPLPRAATLPPRRWRRLGLALLLAALIGALMVLAATQAQRRAERVAGERAQEQLRLYAGALQSFIERYRRLPSVLALDAELRAALRGEPDAAQRAALSRKLEEVNGLALTSTLTLIDRQGRGLAASNWRSPRSNVGVDYSFRPYFLQARREGSGRFYGIGITTGVPGYFLAQAVRDEDGSFLGAVVVKIVLAELESEWAGNHDIVLVSDEHGVVLLSNRSPWRYRELRSPSAAEREERARSQQYAGLTPQPLNRDRVARDYLWRSLALPGEHWQLHLLHARGDIAAAGRSAALASGASLTGLLFLLLFVQQRRRLLQLQKRSRAELEELVRQNAQALRSAQDAVVAAAQQAAQGQVRSLEHLPQGVSVIDAELRLVSWNRRYAEIFRYPPELLRVGRPIEELLRYNAARGLLGVRDLEAEIHKRLQHLRAGAPYTFEREWADGTVLEMRGNPLPGGGFVTAYADITSYKAAARELRELAGVLERRVAQRTEDLAQARGEAERANRAKTRFVAAAVHDLLQPLNAARLYLSALQARLREPETQRVAANIEEALSAQDAILTSLLDISRIESGAIAAEIRDFALQPLFETLAREFSILAQARGLSLRVRATRAIVRSDEALLRRILQNLLSNALRYTRKGGVLLACRREGGQWRIEVWDTGIGIAEHQREEIFEEFRRLDRGGEAGAGLGLAIVERIARRLGHRLSLRSQPGRGSVFALRLPAGESPAPAAVAQVAAGGSSLQQRRIWCIDDDARVREATRELLQGWGCVVRLAAGAEQALALQASEPAPELLLLDHRLGDGEGWQLFDRLAPQWPKPPAVIVISGDQDEALLARWRERGWAYLGKPVKPAALRALIGSLLRRAV